MPLDLLHVSGQVRQMGSLLVSRRVEEERLLRLAHQMLEAQRDRWQELAALAESTRERVAVPTGPLDERIPAPARPAVYSAIATDGSEIDPDRHGGSGSFYLVNIGSALIPYGQPTREAQLRSSSTVGYREEDLFIVDPANPRRRVPVRDRHLDARRTVQEMRFLADLAETEAAQHGDVPLVALVDGTLLFSVLEERPQDFLRGHFYRAFVEEMDRLREADVVLAAYASRTRGIDLINLLQALCDHDPDQCNPCKGLQRPVQQLLPGAIAESAPPAPCALRGLTDAQVLGSQLGLWERSTLLRVRSNVHDPYYREHRAYYFLLNTSAEVARVEVPEWVARDPRKLNLVHAVLVDQCAKGLGYPAALARADDRAVITTTDRQTLDSLVRQEMARRGVHTRASAKLARKQVRAV